MRQSRGAAVILLVAIWLNTGCYHATVVSGATPSTDVINQTFASSWIYGLVPPKTVEAGAKCPNGLAQVETQQSFVNGLVAILTLGIYTPMQITVTCAAKSTAMNEESMPIVEMDAMTPVEAMTRAGNLAVALNDAVLVRFPE